jgi:glycosyltransferase involved in cell wall biosynthesis
MRSAFVLLSYGTFGGAQRRFLNLFFYLNKKETGNFFFFMTGHMLAQVKELFPEEDLENLIPVNGLEQAADKSRNHVSPKSADPSPGKNVRSKLRATFLYKIFYFLRSRYDSKLIFRTIDKVVKERKIEALIGVYSGIFPLYLYLSRSKKRPGIIFCNMDSWFAYLSENPRGVWYKKYRLFNYAHTHSDLVDFLSPVILEGVTEKGIVMAPEKVRITASSFTDYSKCRIGNKDKMRIAFAGRLEKEKNPLLFLDAALLLAKEYPDAEFHIMGEGRLSGETGEIVKNSHLSNIIFHGFYPSPTEIFAETSVFISIQSTNNYPSQSVLEAMACGNAIIATDVGDTRMFVNEDNGTLITLDTDSLAGAIRFYLDNPGKAKEKGAFAARYVRENFTIEKAAAYYLGLFETVANKRSKSDAMA